MLKLKQNINLIKHSGSNFFQCGIFDYVTNFCHFRKRAEMLLARWQIEIHFDGDFRMGKGLVYLNCVIFPFILLKPIIFPRL